MGHQALLSLPRLILITDTTRAAPERFPAVVEAALRGGVDTVLVRERQLDSARLLALCSQLRALTASFRARLLVHTQADAAAAVAADGVHVAAADIDSIPAIRAWLADAGILVSASCHDAAELAHAARVGADFALLSPVFRTMSHPHAVPLGIKRFKRLAAQAPLPVVALGGITPETRPRLKGYGVAVIGAIVGAADPEAAARALCG